MSDSEKFPPQQQEQPGRREAMDPTPESEPPDREKGRLSGKVALITGGDSGIGRAVALAFAEEGADVAIAYLEEHEDAESTAAGVREHGGECLAVAGDIGDETFCSDLVDQVIEKFGRLDVLVNSAGEQHQRDSFDEIDYAALDRIFRTNVYSHSWLTRALAQRLAERGIRVNGVAPGPIWTPLIPASFPPDKVEEFGTDTPLGRAGQPDEVAPCFVFLASDESSYMTGQTLHPNGGEQVGS